MGVGEDLDLLLLRRKLLTPLGPRISSASEKVKEDFLEDLAELLAEFLLELRLELFLGD